MAKSGVRINWRRLWVPVTDPRDPATINPVGKARYEINPAGKRDTSDEVMLWHAYELRHLRGPDGKRDGWTFWSADGRYLCERI